MKNPGSRFVNTPTKERIKLMTTNYIRHNAGGRREHCLIAEAAFGKQLPPDAHVHHIDGDGRNNDNSNLVICPNLSYHKLVHQRQKLLEYINSNASDLTDETGIYWQERNANHWMARLHYDDYQYDIGSFYTKKEAIEARLQRAREVIYHLPITPIKPSFKPKKVTMNTGGVSYDRTHNRYKSYYHNGERRVNVGTFRTREEAENARDKALALFLNSEIK
jgi:hypothetical protein